MIAPEIVDQVRQASDVVQVIGSFVRLRRKGRTFEALCPFHTEKTPSFKVNPDRQIYHCFGCGKGGNVFSFLMEHERLSFVEAVRFLAQRAGIVIRESERSERRDDLEKLHFAHQLAVDYYRGLLSEPAFRSVLQSYLIGKRAITAATIEQFSLGLAGEDWDGFLRYARQRDLTDDDLLKAGLALRSEKQGTCFDRFRQRLMIPIYALGGKPIAFGGRTLKKGEQIKYMNSPETPLYHKGQVLYGLHASKDSIRQSNEAIIVEGYFDFLSLWQSGVTNVVASSGTAFTATQARLLARFAETVYLFFDADSAGQQAALRSVDSLFEAGLEVKIVRPPAGEDPDSIARAFGQERVRQLVDQAESYLAFRAHAIQAAAGTVAVKEKLVKELAALGAKLTDPTRRAVFLQEAADRLAVPIDVMLLPMTAARKPEERTTVGVDRNRIEQDFLASLADHPAQIDRVFETIAPEDFDSRLHGRIFAAFRSQYASTGRLDIGRLIADIDDTEAVSLLTEIAAEEVEPEIRRAEASERLADFTERKRKRVRARLQEALARAEAAGKHDEAEALLEELKVYGL